MSCRGFRTAVTTPSSKLSQHWQGSRALDGGSYGLETLAASVERYWFCAGGAAAPFRTLLLLAVSFGVCCNFKSVLCDYGNEGAAFGDAVVFWRVFFGAFVFPTLSGVSSDRLNGGGQWASFCRDHTRGSMKRGGRAVPRADVHAVLPKVGLRSEPLRQG